MNPSTPRCSPSRRAAAPAFFCFRRIASSPCRTLLLSLRSSVGAEVRMEIIIIISFVMLLVLGALFVIPKSPNKGKEKEANSNTNAKTFGSYTKEEISAHNTRTDCWVIIKDKVVEKQ
ncbi:hypothetical protein GUJ93_ZPchr0008g14052 [Zizania palustris]|uniref:Uncharacterized protein n=1 Tax=Zizania palustris TaxID=103762 RepID=A0A8J5QZ03_ZIZPA|nr:hypothetical protein GUJ93_ZPchr0008g14052 [Zizania palustris]